MELQSDRLYYKNDLQKYLKSKGLPFSYPTILRYERLGLIPSPRRAVDDFTRKWRIYTGDEIKVIASILSERDESPRKKTKRQKARA